MDLITVDERERGYGQEFKYSISADERKMTRRRIVAT